MRPFHTRASAPVVAAAIVLATWLIGSGEAIASDRVLRVQSPPPRAPRLRFGIGYDFGVAAGGNSSGLGILGAIVNVGVQWSDLVGVYVSGGATSMLMAATARGALMIDFTPRHFFSVGLGPSLEWFTLVHLDTGMLFNQGVMVGAPLRFTFRPTRAENSDPNARQGMMIVVDAAPGVVIPHDGFAASFGFSWFFGLGWETH